MTFLDPSFSPASSSDASRVAGTDLALPFTVYSEVAAREIADYLMTGMHVSTPEGQHEIAAVIRHAMRLGVLAARREAKESA